MDTTAIVKVPEGLTAYGVTDDRMEDYLKCWQEYVAGTRVLLQLARKFGVPEPTMRRWAKLNEWHAIAPPPPLTPAQRKQQMIENHFAGLDKVPLSSTNDELLQQVAASQDIADMEAGLAICRLAMKRLHLKVKREKNPRELKVILEANKLAVETIRKVRNLDNIPSNQQDSYEAQLMSLIGSAEAAGLIPPLIPQQGP